jgi:hypothetical protein
VLFCLQLKEPVGKERKIMKTEVCKYGWGYSNIMKTKEKHMRKIYKLTRKLNGMYGQKEVKQKRG